MSVNSTGNEVIVQPQASNTQDFSMLMAMISDLQKTIALLTSRLARYEKQDLEKEKEKEKEELMN